MRRHPAPLYSPYSTEWWRSHFDSEEERRLGQLWTPEGRKVLEAAATMLANALAEIRAMLGDSYVTSAIRRFEGAVAKRDSRPLTGYKLRVARAHRTMLTIRGGSTPAFLEDAVWVVLTARALRPALTLPGSESLVRKLLGPDSDETAFEILTASWFSHALDGTRVRFEPPSNTSRTPDLSVGLEDGQWASLECKRQRERGGADEREKNMRAMLEARLRKLLRNQRGPVTVTASTSRIPDGEMIEWLVRATRSALDSLTWAPGDSQRRELPGRARVLVQVRAPNDHSMQFSSDELLPGAGVVTASMSFEAAARGELGPPPAYVLLTALGGGQESSLRSLIDRACQQLDESGGGAVAIWSRANDPQKWDNAVAAVQNVLQPGAKSRISGVYLFGADVTGLITAVPSADRCLRVRWIPHPAPKSIRQWPVV